VSNDKPSATWHPRPCRACCQWCGQSFGTDWVCEDHESKCDLRPKEGT
jgi:hypothetical protein